ncbi:MAG TPA: LysM peptidoglycan-binding domain-containing protein, partial [Anaeromyxobacteraceae bacterium]|nr:LysM peptidoglycan-binding domain-containing protein [Anaeromyxobacteraceae bacterium]
IKPGTEIVIPMNSLARESVAPASPEPEPLPTKSPHAHRIQLARSQAGSARKAKAMRLAAAPNRVPSTVQVRAGDSLWTIAQRFGVALQELCRWNGIRNPRRFKLQVGRALVVYPRHAAAFNTVGTARAG